MSHKVPHITAMNIQGSGLVKLQHQISVKCETTSSIPSCPSKRAPRSLSAVFVELVAPKDLQRGRVRHGSRRRLEQLPATDDEQTDDEDTVCAVRFVQPVEMLA